jgi:hypothetical protein
VHARRRAGKRVWRRSLEVAEKLVARRRDRTGKRVAVGRQDGREGKSAILVV